MKTKKKAVVDNSLRNVNLSIVSALACFAFIALISIAKKIFDDEFGEVIRWWLMLLASGIAFMPITMLFLRKFKDCGWIFSKVIGIAVSGWFMWLLASIKILKFTEANCWISLIICFAGNIFIYLLYIRKHKTDFTLFENPREVVSHALIGELLFLTVFIIWNYMKAFKPEAYGQTEKMMDYGFMKAMFKSDYMPPEDLWLAGQPINYYYVGQFMATFMTKLAGTGVEYGYNLTLNMLAALGFSLPCAIVFNVAENYKEEKKGIKDGVFPYIAGGISGLAVSIAGNMHYCIFNNVAPAVRSILGLEKFANNADEAARLLGEARVELGLSNYTESLKFSSYWFPNATRYIGYNPVTNDKTIHEFPSYSFVLGDLHAHVINIMFVLTVIAILYGLLRIYKDGLKNAEKKIYFDRLGKNGNKKEVLNIILAPSILIIGFFIGLFHTTNYWDYPIYFVVSGAVILFMNCRLYNFKLDALKVTMLQAVVVIVTAKLTALPFIVNFKQIASQLNICESHTPLWQLAILWGLPVTVTLVFLGCLIKEKKGYAPVADRLADDPGRKNVLYRFIANLNVSDMFILILGLCAIGLVILPEVVYVKDIYSGDYKRANTMFKLTYQSFIMFGMVMGYAIPKFLFYAKKTSHRVFGIITIWLLVSTFGYFDNATKAWFGEYSFITEEGEIEKDLDFVFNCVYVIMGIIFAMAILYLFMNIQKTVKRMLIAGFTCFVIIITAMVLYSSYYFVRERYKGLNSGLYLRDEYFEDFEATNWINENIEGRPVMLEANGNSYTYYERVSTITGLPTILGWRTHEWLWQSTSADGSLPAIITERENDIATIYTSYDVAEVKRLLDKYNVEYIYIGKCEREKFAGTINFDGLMSLCEICYPSDFVSTVETGTFILKVVR